MLDFLPYPDLNFSKESLEYLCLLPFVSQNLALMTFRHNHQINIKMWQITECSINF